MSSDRFIDVYKEGVITGYKIVVDSNTGVNYLVNWSSYGSGITVLLDSNGKPTISLNNK